MTEINARNSGGSCSSNLGLSSPGSGTGSQVTPNGGSASAAASFQNALAAIQANQLSLNQLLNLNAQGTYIPIIFFFKKSNILMVGFFQILGQQLYLQNQLAAAGQMPSLPNLSALGPQELQSLQQSLQNLQQFVLFQPGGNQLTPQAQFFLQNQVNFRFYF